VKDLHASELMQDPAVSGIGVGQSDDNPGDPALVVFLNSQPGSPIPEQIDGVRTKVVRGSQFRPETAQQLASLPAISRSEIARAQLTKARHVQELMENSAILGVGVGASNDSPGESALVVFVDKAGAATVPAEIDGVRTRVIVTDPIRTFNWGHGAVKACSRISQPLWRKASRIAP
jgi:hypothetical protein